jgi:putative membrane protein
MDKPNTIKDQIIVFIKGIAMGTANVIPGISGGTIALITGVFERLINALKSFDLQAIKLLFGGNFKKFAQHVDLFFLVSLFVGVGVAIISFARFFEFILDKYPIFIWAYFFGPVLASAFFIGKTVKKRNLGIILLFVTGITIAVFISLTTPGTQNDNFWYLLICGIVVMCSMLLPGLSGSFMLILMGNFQLMMESVNQWRFEILIPFLAGAVVGLIAFSRFLSWLLKRFPDATIALLTGFIIGSLGILWPWKTEIIKLLGTTERVVGYEWFLPQINSEFFIAALLCILGVATIYVIEWVAKKMAKE